MKKSLRLNVFLILVVVLFIFGCDSYLNTLTGETVTNADWILANASDTGSGVITMHAIRNRTEYAYIPLNWDGHGDVHISVDVRTTSGFSYAEYTMFGIFPDGFQDGLGLQGEKKCYFTWGYADGQSQMQAKFNLDGSCAGMNPPTNEWLMSDN